MVRAKLERLQDDYDTRGLLASIDELVNLICDEDGLRDMLLRLHAMAHTVINDAPMAVSSENENLPDLAFEVSMRSSDAIEMFSKLKQLVEPLAELAGGDLSTCVICRRISRMTRPNNLKA